MISAIVQNFTGRLAARADGEGQILAEYALILGLVVIAAVGALALVGGAVVTPFSTFVEASGISGGS